MRISPRNPTNDVDIQYFSLFSLFNLLMQLNVEREFAEEMGTPAPAGATIELGSVRSGSKTIHGFGRAGDFDAESAVSNLFEMEWPRGSGQLECFPEMDRAAWVDLTAARTLLVKGQLPFLDRLEAALA